MRQCFADASTRQVDSRAERRRAERRVEGRSFASYPPFRLSVVAGFGTFLRAWRPAHLDAWRNKPILWSHMSIRSTARAIRAQPTVNAALLAPFRLARRLGVGLPHQVYSHLPFHGPFQVECDEGRSFRMMSHGHQLENGIYWRGLRGYEPETLGVWTALSASSSVVLDIGANTGLFALIAASAPTRPNVHAFEPVPRIANLLRANVDLNPQYSIQVHECAAGSRSGSLPIHDPGGDNAYSASLNPDFLSSARKSVYSVPVVAVDDVMASDQQVDLIKLDVEGFEHEALAGMERTLTRWRPVLIMEALGGPDAGGADAQADPFARLGYRTFHLGANGPEDAASRAGDLAHRNLLRVPSERADVLLALVRRALR